MIPTFGFAFLLLTFCINIFIPIFSCISLKKKTPIKERELITLSFFSLLTAILSQLCLIYSFLISDYSVLNVYQNSHHLKPIIYKIAGSFGNHEGSMLLLVTILSAYAFAFALLSKIDGKNKIIILSSQSCIIALFAAFTAFTSNPFLRNFPIPEVGLGLNPILQDIGLALHPPMLYTGYIGFSLVFSFAIAGLFNKKIDREFAIRLRSWLFFSYGFLTLGIGLGAWWAYRELGWGGYWFWDPVENVSLMPWLTATALIHSLKLLERKEILKIWTSFLAILTFILCLLGIFLVRSGMLTSVHSFAVDAKRGFFIIAIVTLIGGAALLLLGIRIPDLKSDNKDNNNNGDRKFFWSKIGAILLNNYLLIVALFTVLLGTLYPVFSRSFFNQFIVIGPDFYNKILSIFLAPLLLFLAISYDLDDTKNTARRDFLNRDNVLTGLVSATLSSLVFLYQKDIHFWQILILFLAIFSFLKTLVFAESFVIGFAHSGFSLIIIGIVLSACFGSVKEVNLKLGERINLSGYELEFSKIDYVMEDNFIAREGEFSLLKSGKLIGKLNPQLRFYPISNQTTNETSIEHMTLGDFYVVMGNKDEQERYAVRVYHKPFIWLIWTGCLMIFLAMVVGIKFTSRPMSNNAASREA